MGTGSLRSCLMAVVAAASCADWVILSADTHVWTWKFYVYWYSVQTEQWDEAAALQAYQNDGPLWLQFLRDARTAVYLYKNGFERPPAEEVDRTTTAFVRQKPWGARLDPALLRRVMEMILAVRSYRDRIFRNTLLIPPEQVRQRYEQLYPDPATRPPWEQVYNAIHQSLLDEAVAREFPRWQDQLRQSLPLRVHPFPEALCRPRP